MGKKVKIFHSKNSIDLEYQINTFLNQKTARLIDIKFVQLLNAKTVKMTAMLIYALE